MMKGMMMIKGMTVMMVMVKVVVAGAGHSDPLVPQPSLSILN